MEMVQYDNSRQLSVAQTSNTASSPFKVPRDWRVRKVLRRDGSHYDRYYYEPGTGRKFRSTKEVQRYLNGDPPRSRRSSRISSINNGYQRLLPFATENSEGKKMLVSGGKLFPLDDGSESDSAIVASRKASSILPDGWIMEEVPRNYNTNMIDRYYYEPDTGMKFRSLIAVQKHLAEVEEYSPLSEAFKNYGYQRFLPSTSVTKNSESRKMIVSSGELFSLDDENESYSAIVASTKAAVTASSILPDGWVMEEVPRKNTTWVDKYYYEPDTGMKFRSMIAVQKYLAELEENTPLSNALEQIKENKPLSRVFKMAKHSKDSTPGKKCNSGENTKDSSSMGPPMKVNWVLGSPQGDVWNPFISGTLVSDPIKKQWADRFMILMNE